MPNSLARKIFKLKTLNKETDDKLREQIIENKILQQKLDILKRTIKYKFRPDIQLTDTIDDITDDLLTAQIPANITLTTDVKSEITDDLLTHQIPVNIESDSVHNICNILSKKGKLK